MRLIRFSLALSFLLIVSSPLFADTLVRSGDRDDFGFDFVALSVPHSATFHNYSLRDDVSSGAGDFDWADWAHSNVVDRDGDHGLHWGWYEHKHKHEHIINSGDGWNDEDGSSTSKPDPAVPEPSALILLASGLVGLVVAWALNKLCA